MNSYFSSVYADIGDIGHWRDSIGGQIPGTAFGGFNFDQEIRNDGIYTKPSDDTIQLSEAGDYLIIATTHDLDTSNGRYNSQLRVEQTVGSGDVFSSYYSGYSRNNAEDQSWTRAVSIVVGASANSQVQIQKRRDTDAPTGGSVANNSDIQIIRLTQTNYGIYSIGGTGNTYGGITPNTVSLDSVLSESDNSAIEGNVGADSITLKGDNRKYLVAWSTSFTTGGNRTQRIGHLEYDGTDKLSTRAYCYSRNNANEYCGLGSMDIVETATSDISLQTEVYRGDGVGADQGGANNDGSLVTDGNGQIIVLELPEYLEALSSEDSVGLQDVTANETLNFSRDILFNDAQSFTKNTDSQIAVTNSSDIFSWTNIWTARNNVSTGARQTTFGSIVIDGVEQSTGKHGSYARGNQGTTDTFGLGFQPAGVFTTTGPGTTLGINTTPITGGAAGGTDRTQPGTLGFFALNLDTLVAPELEQSVYRFFENTNSSDVGTPLVGQNTPAVLSSNGQEFRLRALINTTKNKLRQNEKNFKLQFAQKVGVCDVNFTGEVYNDVTTTTEIAFNNNASPNDGDNLTSNINDPINGGNTIVNQSYEELNNFTNSVAQIEEDQDGKWDFSLIDNTAPDNTSYCFRIVESDGSFLNSYGVIPEITTSPVPGPGGVSAGLNLWLKSNTGTSTSTDGTNLVTWNDQSGNAKNASAVNAPIYRNNTSDNLNHYPVVNFNGINDAMENTTGGMSSKSYFAVVVPTNTIDGTTSGGVPFGLECTNATVDTGTCGLPFGGLVLGSFTVAIPDEVITHGLGSSANYRSAEVGAESYPAGKPMLVMVNEDAAGTIANIYEKGERLDNFTFNAYQSVSNTNYSLGRSLDGTYPFYYEGDIAEIINFDDRLEDSDRIKIESYLAIKYGITLQSGTQDYINSNSSITFWDSSIAGVYTNDIFGIGRDDLQSLAQVESKSVNDGGVIKLHAVGEGTNISPSFSDISNNEFFMVSNDGNSNTWSAGDAPIGYDVLAKKWIVQETGDTGTIDFDFNVANPDFDIPAAFGGTYYFVYDSNSNGNLSDEIPTAMTNLGGNIYRAAGQNLSNGQKFTISTIRSSNNIPTDISLSPTSIDENSSAGSTVGTLSSSDLDITDTHTYTLTPGVGDSDNIYFSISGTTLSLNHSPDYEIRDSYSIRIQTDDGNGGQFQKVFNITINNLGESNTSSIDFENALDDYKYTVTSGDWSRTTTNPFTGSFSMESDNAGANNSQSCFEVNHNSNTTGTIDFRYNVSSQAGGDFLRFYIDNIEQGAGWSGTVPWSQYTSASQTAGSHNYKWCYIKNANTNTGTDSAFIDDINFISDSLDTTDPLITSTSVASGSLLPGGNHNISITYSDADSGIDSGSIDYALNKWDGISAYGSDISGTSMSLVYSDASNANLSFDDLEFGKYRFTFSIDDNAGNTSFTQIIFYIDEPEFIVSTPEIDLGILSSENNVFSPTVTITVKTVGAGFDVTMDRSSPFSEGLDEIPSYNGSLGYGFQQTPYTSVIAEIGSSENIASEGSLINTNGNKNTYTYEVQIGALIDQQQSAGNYIGDLDFNISLDY